MIKGTYPVHLDCGNSFIYPCGRTKLVKAKEGKMTGLVKPRKIDFKDTNLALFGSDVERNVSYSLGSEMTYF